MSPGKRSPARPWVATGCFRTHPVPPMPRCGCPGEQLRCRRRPPCPSELGTRQPRHGSISRALSAHSPVHPAGREEPRKPAVHPGLATVTRAAEKLKVLQRERPPERLGSHRPGDVDSEPVVQLVGRPAAALAHRDLLYAGGLLSGCDAIGGQAVVVPCEMNRRGVLAAPSADSPDRSLPPARGPGDQPPGVRRRVSDGGASPVP